jgi:hypothetical protein
MVYVSDFGCSAGISVIDCAHKADATSATIMVIVRIFFI